VEFVSSVTSKLECRSPVSTIGTSAFFHQIRESIDDFLPPLSRPSPPFLVIRRLLTYVLLRVSDDWNRGKISDSGLSIDSCASGLRSPVPPSLGLYFSPLASRYSARSSRTFESDCPKPGGKPPDLFLPVFGRCLIFPVPSEFAVGSSGVSEKT